MPRAELIIGPVLRHVGERDATVWVETDAACEVEILGSSSTTFAVAGHHYALVVIESLQPGEDHPYEVRLDGELAWPPPEWPYPASSIRTMQPGGEVRLGFGSCRVAAPHEPPYCLRKDEDEEGREIDALAALAERMRAEPRERWPHQMLFLGDQVYADEVSPKAMEFIRSRRESGGEHGDEVADFEEYTRLYWESWSSPPVRWVLSTVASAMIFDDHDVHDDWNTSYAWREHVTGESWWMERITGAFMSYWLYQHLGNLSVHDLRADPLFAEISQAAAGDGEPVLRDFARRADAEPASCRWSFRRDLGTTRLVVIDARAGRVLTPEHRDMLDPVEWEWLEEQLTGDVDHLLIATSLPFLLGGGMHDLEAWNEAVSQGAWGPRAAVLGERVRQALDLEHWAAFQRSFRRLASIVADVAGGRRGRAPASIVFLSGDVHHAYLAEAEPVSGSAEGSPIFQAVCSPFRNPLNAREQRAIRAAISRPAAVAARLAAKAAGVPPPPLAWRVSDGPWFDNQVATLTLNGRASRLAIERSLPVYPETPRLEIVLDRGLTRERSGPPAMDE